MSVKIQKRQTPKLAETVELFELDGKGYHVPAKPRVNVSLKYLRLVREEGVNLATAYLLEELLGKEGFTALTEYDDLEPEEFKQIMAAARTLAVGALEPHKS